ncbi:MAG: DUF2975 domain-containing protein [Ruminococcaceae bacterium]|nr:DUF2975 domain-containing protein [Oscillospiraceae bacterium]
MKQKALARWLKAAVIGVALCLAVVYLLIIPDFGKSIAAQNPEFAFCYWPWLIFLWCTALPCIAALILGWGVAGRIGKDRSFCMENARALRAIAFLAAGDAAFFFLGNVVFLFLNMSHPGVVLASLLGVFAGVAVAIAAAALSHLVRKAAELQEQSDYTI